MAFNGNWAEACEYIARVWGTDAANVNNILSQYEGMDAATAVQKYVYDFKGTPAYVSNAEINYYNAANGAKAWQYAKFSGTSTADMINSNTVTRTAIRTPVNTSITTTQGTTKFAAKIGMREAGSFVFGEVVPAICAAGWGITLGKTIDSALYNANPDFWNAHGMSTLNPETWNSITTGYDGVAGTLFNLVFGLDGNKAQAYMDEDAAAYIALWMKQQGIFDQGVSYSNFNNIKSTLIKPNIYPNPLYFSPNGAFFTVRTNYGTYTDTTEKAATVIKRDTMPGVNFVAADRQPFTVRRSTGQTLSSNPVTRNGETFYTVYDSATGVDRYASNVQLNVTTGGEYERWDLAKIMLDGDITTEGGVDGIGDQSGATQPDTSNWNDLQSTKESLQQQYPNLWTNAKHNDYIEDDGTQKSKTYIPINLPNISNRNDTQPTSGDRSQGDPEIDPATATKDLIDNITKIVTEQPTPTDNTPTGSGSTPDVTPPSGSASSLWAVYNPTQAQVDAFGSWLWSSDLVEQIKKLFNDPMQAIIGIHKVFATPPTSGTGTIKCGYIDSGVSSALVSKQYTTINCGTVSLSEYFGNVFDYSPFTEISLYLPFIGIVRLDTSDVMRSSINVKYHVDVITGACLADVKVTRDGENSVLYQYAGSCIVTYPLSSGSYASALTGIVSIAGGAIASVASGGALAPVALGAAVGATKLHSDIQKSGSFTGAAGAMGCKKPYLIISRPQTALPSNYKKYEGNPARHYTTVGDCSGFIRVKDVHVDKMSASNKELDMIEQLLKSGIEV